MIGEIIGITVPVVGAAVFFALRVEHRLTRLETKLDSLLNKNGIDPKSCTKSKKGEKEERTRNK